jgi:hypothetical protein
MAILRSDTFNRADGALGTPSDAGSAWTTVGVGVTLAGNQAVGDIFGGPVAGVAWLEASEADAATSVTLKAVWNSGNPTGPAVRSSDYQNYIGLECYAVGLGDTETPQIVKVEAGSRTVLQTIAGVTTAVNDVMKLEASGTTIKAYKNGVQIGTDQTGVTFNQTVTKHGMMFGSGNPTRNALDDFQIEDVGGGGGGGTKAPPPRRQRTRFFQGR